MPMAKTKNAPEKKVPVDSLEKVSKEEIQTRLSAAQLSNNWEEASKLINELQRRERPLQTDLDKFNKSYEELQKKVKKGTATEEELKKFFKTDVKNYKSGVDKNVKDISAFNEKKVADLQKQLNDLALDRPSIKDYFSFKRRRLVNITRALDKFKEDKEHYPKNLLIYCMWIMNSNLIGARQKMKRWWIKLRWKWKSDDIKGWLKTLEEKVKPNENDTAQRKIVKQMIQEKLVEAKHAYVEDVKSKVF